MPRRKAAIKREALPDHMYGSEQIAKFINVIMYDGEKSIAEKIVYSALNSLADKVKKAKADDEAHGEAAAGANKASSKAAASTSTSAVKGKPKKSVTTHTPEEVLEILRKTLGNVAPTVEVKSRRVGGATYQVPIEVAPDRGLALAMRWVVYAARKRSEKTMALRLGAELHDAYLGRGASIKTRDDVHRMAKANQAFAHYRW